MIRISTDLHEIEIVEAVHRLGRKRVRDLIWLLARYTDDPEFLVECRDLFCDAVSRQRALGGLPARRAPGSPEAPEDA